MSKVYEVVVVGRSREVYRVDADSKNDALSKWKDETPVSTEIDDVEVESVDDTDDLRKFLL